MLIGRSLMLQGADAQQGVYYNMDGSTKSARPRVVVLGSGWGAMSFLKSLPSNIK